MSTTDLPFRAPPPNLSEPMDRPLDASSIARAVLVVTGTAILVFVLLEVLPHILGALPLGGLGRVRSGAAVAAASFAALWLLAIALVRVTREPRNPRAAPATDQLRPEPPAVANLLVNNFRVTRDAVPATLLDLAARKVVDLDQVGPDHHLVRLRRQPDGALAGYEAAVLHLLRSRAEGGVVPAGALTTGPREHARGWWRSFRRAVVADARQRGLCRDLWDAPALATLTVLGLLPAPFVGIAAGELEAGILAGFLAVAVVGALRGTGRQRETREGLAAGSTWLGVRRHLRDGAHLGDLPPSAVAVWERYLAYAAALGVAGGAVRAIPMGADSDRRAWSSHGGRWRQIRIRYPALWPPAWGWHPVRALLTALVAGGVSAAALTFVVDIGWLVRADADPWPLVLGYRAVVALFAVLAVAGTAWAAVTLVMAAADLGGVREVTGRVVRMRTRRRGGESEPLYYVAIDDGRPSTLRALRVTAAQYRSGLREGADATATVTPGLHHVRSIRPA